ncbi:MAG: HAD family hydrolase [Deltaproteobacteria bacterium]|nr:HAD family hydrolase [Deltaproteobacteria bacterium]
MTRAILFDFGGTLDFPRHWLDRFVAHYQAAGADIERTAFDRAFTLATRKAYASSATLRNYSLSQLVGFLVDLQLENLGHGSAWRHSLTEPRSTQGTRELVQRIRDSFVSESAVGFAMARPLLASLAQSFKIAVVSNFYGNLDRVIAEAGFLPSVSAIADSGLVGFYKPDPRIFATALSRLAVEPQHAVMVGDSIAKDCAPAREMGMKTVWLRHRGVNGQIAPSAMVDVTIDSLEELKNFRWTSG